MPLTIELTEELDAELRRLASERGAEVGIVVVAVLNEALRRRALARGDLGELLRELAARQQQSPDCTSEDEAMALALSEQRAVRDERSASGAVGAG